MQRRSGGRPATLVSRPAILTGRPATCVSRPATELSQVSNPSELDPRAIKEAHFTSVDMQETQRLTANRHARTNPSRWRQ